MINNPIQFICESLEPFPCVVDTYEYIKVADIMLVNVDERADQLRIELSGEHSDYFIIDNLKLYIKGSVLDFNEPQQTYTVSVSLLDSATSNIIVTRTHSVCAFPCECD